MDLLKDGQFVKAKEELDKVDPIAHQNMKYLMLRGRCLIGLEKYKEAIEAFQNAKISVSASNLRAIDKEYLCLFADYMCGYIRDKSGSGFQLETFRGKAKSISAQVKTRYIVDYPIE